MSRIVGRNIQTCQLTCARCCVRNGIFDRIAEDWVGGGCDPCNEWTSYTPLLETFKNGRVIEFNGRKWRKWGKGNKSFKFILNTLVDKNSGIYYASHQGDDKKTCVFVYIFICDVCLARGQEFYIPKIYTKIKEGPAKNRLNRFDEEIECCVNEISRHKVGCACGGYLKHQKELKRMKRQRQNYINWLVNLSNY